MEELLKSLIYIQQNLNAPKDQYNSFGKYKYRSLEGIQAALKPLLADQGCGIRFEDEIVDHSGRTFLKTTLVLFNDKGQTVSTTALAEHAETKTGMDSAQITGAASSYARKYAMNALFAIDDTQDADTEAFHNQQQKRTTTTRKTSAPAQSYDPNSGIKAELSQVKDMNSLMVLYQKYRTLVDTDASVRELFTQTRIKLAA